MTKNLFCSLKRSLAFRIYSNKRRGAYLIFRLLVRRLFGGGAYSEAALNRRRRLFGGGVSLKKRRFVMYMM